MFNCHTSWTQNANITSALRSLLPQVALFTPFCKWTSPQRNRTTTCLVAIKIKLLWWKGKVGSFKADAVRRLHWIISDMTVHYYILQAHIWMTISLCQLYSFRTLADPSLASASSVFRVRHWSVSHSWEEKKKVKAASVGVFWVKTGGISHELVAEAAHQWSEPDGISGVL